jgi:hypothetical protein
LVVSPSSRTVGTTLSAVKRCSVARVPLAAQDGCSAYGLLFLACYTA